MPEKQDNKVLDDSVQRILAKIQAENPGTKPVTVSPSNNMSSVITRFMMPRGAQAVTNPFTGNITYDPSAVAGMSPVETEQMLAHELTHSRQAQQTPFYKTLMSLFTPSEDYEKRPVEMEAFQTEKDRMIKKGLSLPDPVTGARDIPLPKSKKK